MLPGLTNLAIGTGGNKREAKRLKMQQQNPPVRFRFFLKGEIPNESMNDLEDHMRSSFYNYLCGHTDLLGICHTTHLSIEIIPKNTLSSDYWGTPITEARFALSGGTDYLKFIDHAEEVNDPSGWLKYTEFMEEIFSIGPIRQGDRSEPIQDNGNLELLALYDELDKGLDPLGLTAATKESPYGPDDTEELLQTPSGIKRLYSPSALYAWDNWSFNYNDKGSEEAEEDTGDPEEEAGEQGFGELSAEGASAFFPDRAAEAASSAAAL